MCRACDFEDEAERIRGMIEDGQYDFALETLEGILSWVEDNEHVTDAQIHAVNNIEASVER